MLTATGYNKDAANPTGQDCSGSQGISSADPGLTEKGTATKITGQITANLWAKLSTTDATLIAVLSEVEPSGASNQITAGYLLASQREVDPALSTYRPKHALIRPWHPFTKESQHAVTPNEATEYNVEIYPTSAIVKPGNRLRLTIGTANTFTTLTPLPSLGQELGGTLTVLHDSQHQSNVLLPITP